MTTSLTAPASVRSSNRLARFAPMLDQVANPLGFEAGDANVSRYVGNAPTNATDPSGLQPPKAADESAERPWIVIVTGFGKFPGDYDKDEANPSNPLAKQLEKELKGRTIECESITPIPVNWGEIDKVIAKQTEKHKDARIIWIAFGAGPAFRIETRGDNTRLEGPDDAGQTPGVDVPSQNDTTPGAKDREVSQLTKEALQAIQEALKAQRFRVAISKEAGNYICESTAYGLHKAQRTGKIEAGIFIHTPPTLTAKQREEFAKALVDALFKDGEPIPGRLVPLPSKTK